MPWWIWLVIVAVVVLGLEVVVFAVVIVGGQSEERRGGLLELDTWAARNALRHRPAETVIGGVECGFARAQSRFLGRCGHLIQVGNEYVVRSVDGARFCSPRCVEASPTSRVRPFAGSDEAA